MPACRYTNARALGRKYLTVLADQMNTSLPLIDKANKLNLEGIHRFA